MSSRTATRLAWGTCAASVVLTSAALAFVVLNHSNPDEGTIGSQVGNAFFLVALLTFSTVGALVASRRPENPIGWIFLSLGAMFAISAFANEYATYALVAEPGALPAGMAMAWLQSWLFLAPLILSGTLVFLLFPNGRLLSRRWLPVLWAAGAGSCWPCSRRCSCPARSRTSSRSRTRTQSQVRPPTPSRSSRTWRSC